MIKPNLPFSDSFFGTITENFNWAEQNLGALAQMTQVHGDTICYAQKPTVYPDCDALVTDKTDLWLCVKTADCLPILISSPQAVAAVHCGWKGLQSNLLRKVLAYLQSEFGASGLDINVGIGPHIGVKHYEIGGEMREIFPDFAFHNLPDGRLALDLAAVAMHQALQAGIPAQNLSHCLLCTFEEDGILHSYRREKQNGTAADGRNLSFICKK